MDPSPIRNCNRRTINTRVMTMIIMSDSTKTESVHFIGKLSFKVTVCGRSERSSTLQ